MAKFTNVSGMALSAQLEMHVQGSKRLHLELAPEERKPLPSPGNIVIMSSDAKVATGHTAALFDGGRGIFTVDLRAGQLGTATLRAQIAQADVASIGVRVAPPLAIPDVNTNAGLWVRLFLAESFNPGEGQYDEKAAKLGMQYMRLVVENRLANDPKQFGASHASSFADILRARDQFDGFDDYPNLPPRIDNRISEVVRVANSDNDARQPAYATFVGNALIVADVPAAIPDPTGQGFFLSNWRKANSGGPGGMAIPFGGPVSGNQFYKMPK